MIKLVTSNFPPLMTKNKTFKELFISNLSKSNKAIIVSGYISSDSLIEIYLFLKVNKRPKVDLIIGMHLFEGLTSNQCKVLRELQSLMDRSDLGKIYFATVSKYHGKVYLFYHDDETPNEIIMGSSNLNSISSTNLTYETDIRLVDESINLEIQEFVFELRDKYCKPLSDVIDDLPIKNKPIDFEEHQGVEKVSLNDLEEIYKSKKDTKITIPLKATERHQKSNLNACHGKGRENKSTGTIIPRPWYEVELIVPKEITSHPEYPEKQKVFDVYTDDGWKFKCKVNGDFKKNFRSEGDLTILGKWIKGRIENKGYLNLGEIVTESTLCTYGRNNFDLIKTNIDNTWIVEFGV